VGSGRECSQRQHRHHERGEHDETRLLHDLHPSAVDVDGSVDRRAGKVPDDNDDDGN
jgi:hypothetical protein